MVWRPGTLAAETLCRDDPPARPSVAPSTGRYLHMLNVHEGLASWTVALREMLHLAAAAGRDFVEPCVRSGTIVPCTPGAVTDVPDGRCRADVVAALKPGSVDALALPRFRADCGRFRTPPPQMPEGGASAWPLHAYVDVATLLVEEGLAGRVRVVPFEQWLQESVDTTSGAGAADVDTLPLADVQAARRRRAAVAHNASMPVRRGANGGGSGRYQWRKHTAPGRAAHRVLQISQPLHCIIRVHGGREHVSTCGPRVGGLLFPRGVRVGGLRAGRLLVSHLVRKPWAEQRDLFLYDYHRGQYQPRRNTVRSDLPPFNALHSAAVLRWLADAGFAGADTEVAATIAARGAANKRGDTMFAVLQVRGRGRAAVAIYCVCTCLCVYELGY